jgi:hypothetical protein
VGSPTCEGPKTGNWFTPETKGLRPSLLTDKHGNATTQYLYTDNPPAAMVGAVSGVQFTFLDGDPAQVPPFPVPVYFSDCMTVDLS